jgi:hypothetical protein
VESYHRLQRLAWFLLLLGLVLFAVWLLLSLGH